jgi:LDH2 family malate/lactate/ureidoglycolate dehydrogenase
VHIPGQRGFALAEERRRSGVPIPETVWREIQDLLSKGTSQENPT